MNETILDFDRLAQVRFTLEWLNTFQQLYSVTLSKLKEKIIDLNKKYFNTYKIYESNQYFNAYE